VVLAEVRAWRGAERAIEAPAASWLPRLAEGLREFHRRGEHRHIELADSEAAALYVELFKYLAWRHGGGSTAMPEEIQLLAKLAG
jgi:hypothetical protein